MADFVKMDDHRKEDGKLNWATYEAARKANGESCQRCGQMIIWPKGYPSYCGSCQRIDKDGTAVHHESLLRCPKCRHQWEVYDSDEYGIYSDGQHDVSCPVCCHDFEITTYVSYSFESPELEAEEDEETSEEETSEEETEESTDETAGGSAA